MYFCRYALARNNWKMKLNKTIPLEPVSGATGGTCPALGAAGSSDDLGLSSRRQPGSFPAAATLNFFTIFSKGGSCSGDSRA